MVLEHKHHGPHNSSIAFNCKVYEWLDTKDVCKVLDEHNLSGPTRQRVIEQYTQTHLDNLYAQVIENEATHFSENWIKGACFESTATITAMLYNCQQTWPHFTTTYPALNNILAKKKEAASACRAIGSFFKDSLTGTEHLSFIDVNEVYRFGRSGGWMRIADASEFEDFKGDAEYALARAYTDRETLSLVDATSRKDWWQEMNEYLNCSSERLTHIQAKCKAVLWVLQEGKEMVKAIDKKFLLDELSSDIINQFLGETKIEITPDELTKWMKGESTIRTNSVSLSYLRINPLNTEKIETSQAVNISLSEGLNLFQHLQNYLRSPNSSEPIHPGMRIGKYEIGSFRKEGDEYYLTVGCHKIPWSHIESFAREVSVKPFITKVIPCGQ